MSPLDQHNWLQAWDFARPLLTPALEQQERHGYVMADVVEMLTDGRCNLWVGDRSAAVVHFAHPPRGPVCTIWLAGGDLNELVETLENPKTAAWARERGAKCIELHGREGWGKPLRPLGFERTAVTYSKSLEE